MDHQGVRVPPDEVHRVDVGQLGVDAAADLVLVQGEEVVPLLHAGDGDDLLRRVGGVPHHLHGVHPEKDYAAQHNGGEDQHCGQQLIEGAEAPPVPPSPSVPSRRHDAPVSCSSRFLSVSHPKVADL